MVECSMCGRSKEELNSTVVLLGPGMRICEMCIRTSPQPASTATATCAVCFRPGTERRLMHTFPTGRHACDECLIEALKIVEDLARRREAKSTDARED